LREYWVETALNKSGPQLTRKSDVFVNPVRKTLNEPFIYLIKIRPMLDEFTEPGELVVLIALADAEIEPAPGRRSRVAGCSANSTELRRGSTMTAVASRKQRVRAASQVSRSSVAETGHSR
jgi:hypothetical protein